MLPDGATDMTGSTLAAILIPPARAPARPCRLAGARQTPAHRIGARGGDSGQVRQRRRPASPGPGTTIAAATRAGIVAAQIGGGNHAPGTPEAVPKYKVVQGVSTDG